MRRFEGLEIDTRAVGRGALVGLCVIAPVSPVPNFIVAKFKGKLLIVWTPSENENASGVTDVNDMFGPRRFMSSTNPVTLSLVV